MNTWCNSSIAKKIGDNDSSLSAHKVGMVLAILITLIFN